jgi:hypothetical protein
MTFQKEYGVATIDGHDEKIGNFRIEPPGLFRGRGEHPKQVSLAISTVYHLYPVCSNNICRVLINLDPASNDCSHCKWNLIVNLYTRRSNVSCPSRLGQFTLFLIKFYCQQGMVKRRVQPEEVIINCSKDSQWPKPPEGHKWKEVRHDNAVSWKWPVRRNWWIVHFSLMNVCLFISLILFLKVNILMIHNYVIHLESYFI